MEEKLLKTTDDISIRMKSLWARNAGKFLPEPISYLSLLPQHSLWNSCCKIGVVKIAYLRRIGLIQEIQVPVCEIQIDEDKCIQEFIKPSFALDSVLLSSVKKVSFTVMSASKSYIDDFQNYLMGIHAKFQDSR